MNKLSYFNNINESISKNEVKGNDNEDFQATSTTSRSDVTYSNNFDDLLSAVLNKNNNKILSDNYVWMFIGIIVVGGIILNLLTFVGLLKTRCGGKI